MFLYPDMETVLIGRFKNNAMIAASPSRIIAERCHKGIKEIRVAKPKYDAPIVKYDRPNWIRIGDQPTIMDPFERKNTFIQDGKGHDGVFAKKNIFKGDIIAYYSGTIEKASERPPFDLSNQTLSEK